MAQEIVTVLTYYREQQRMSQRTRVYSALLEISKVSAPDSISITV